MTDLLIGHFQVLGELGRGAMGVVYKARDLRLDRLVALKVLRAPQAGDSEGERQLLEEAKAASALNHPNIITIYAVESTDNTSVIAMEYVAGRTLDELIGSRGLPIEQALKYAVQIAEALSVAHAAGIVHRDLKPRNIMVSDQGQVKVLDFGLAQIARATSATASATTVAVEGSIVGTAAYMSPEQAAGKRVDARADVFSFGVVLYEMMSGRQPFLRETLPETFAAILRDDPPPLEDAPAELARLIRRCLRKDPEQRIRHLDDAKLVLEELESELRSPRAAQHSQLSSPVRARPRRLRLILAAAGAVTVVAAVAATVHLYRTSGSSMPTPVPLTSYLGNEVQPAFSPDGNQVAFVWDGEHQDNPDIYVKLIGGSESPLRLTSDPAQDLSPAWSPDGRFIAFVRNDLKTAARVFVIPAIGGPERLVCEFGTSLAIPALGYMVAAPVPLLAWAPDSKSILIADHASPHEPFGLFIVPLATGEKRRITTAPAGSLGDGAPAVRRDERTVIFNRAATLTWSELYRLELTEDMRPVGAPKRLTFSRSWKTSPAWLSGGRDFLFSESNWYLGTGVLRKLAASGRGSPLTLGGMGDDIAWPAVSTDGHRLVFSRATSSENIWRLPLRSDTAVHRAEKLIASTRSEQAPQYSPDGYRIAFASSRSGTPEIWVCDRDGTNAVQLTSLGAPVTGSPHWSPDGKQIVFDSNREGQFDVYVVNAGGGAPRRLTMHPANDALASFSSDQRSLYFSSERTGQWEIWRMPVAGGDTVQVTFAGGRAPLESPDGQLLYFERSYSLWVRSVEGGRETKVLDSIGFLHFALAPNGIYYVREQDLDPRRTILLLDPASRRSVPVFEIGNPIGPGLAVAPDGSSLLFTNIVQRGSDLMLIDGFR